MAESVSALVQKNSGRSVSAAKAKAKTKVVLSAGLALFAMFFGAGNIVFPLYLGANAGEHLALNIIGFLIAGVGVPFLGLLATSMYKGDYWEFFNRLGKLPAFLIITFLLIIIGPFGAMPRVETLVFNTLEPFLPVFLQSNSVFALIFCSLIFVLAYGETKVVDILGFVLSPVKIISFSILVGVGVFFSEQPVVTNMLTASQAFTVALVQGYSTMDLLATFFFCAVAFKGIENSSAKLDVNKSEFTGMIIKSSIIGIALISFAYLGFMFVAYLHSSTLEGVPAEKMICVLSDLILGKFGSLFVCITVSFACLATALALAEVCSNYLHKEIFGQRVSKVTCLLIVTLVTYAMSNLSFQMIMRLMLPILKIIYPALITLSVMNILYKWRGIKMVKFPVYLTVLMGVISSFLL